MVRRSAFDEVGGFAEGIRSGGDVDLCRRLQAAGWGFERRPGAAVAHHHREDLRSFLGMLARYGAGARWLNDRYPGVVAALAAVARELAPLRAATRFATLAAGEREEAAFRLVDALGLVAHNVGYRRDNRADAASSLD